MLVRRPSKWQFPHNAERKLQARLVGIVDGVAAAVKAKLYPKLPQLVAAAARVRGDAMDDDLDRIFQEIRLQIDDSAPDGNDLASAAAHDVSDFNLSQWRAIVKQSLGIDLYTAEPWLRGELRNWASEAASRITSLEDDAIEQVAIWTNRGIREGWRWEDIAKNIEDRFDVSRSRARFIARDQIGTLNGHLTQRRQQAAGVKKFYWRDSRDERVRGNPNGLYPKAIPSHWARNGQLFSWDHPPEDGIPGQPPQCRCTAEPDMSDVLAHFNDETEEQ